MPELVTKKLRPGDIYALLLGLAERADRIRARGSCDVRGKKARLVTAFNGEHNAGIQVLNTSNFADDHGPLRDTKD
jgi:hypothetical protein